MASVVIGDYRYYDTGQVEVVDKTKTSYGNILSSVEIEGQTYSITSMDMCFEGCRSLFEAPEIPNTIVSLERSFFNCRSLIQAPIIPNGVVNMLMSFCDCSSLTTAPEIPESVTNMDRCFSGCFRLSETPNIPASVIDMNRCFYNCSRLVTAPEIPESVIYMDECFAGCENLTGFILIHSKPLDGGSSIFTGTSESIKIYTIDDNNSSEVYDYWTNSVSLPSNVTVESDIPTDTSFVIQNYEYTKIIANELRVKAYGKDRANFGVIKEQVRCGNQTYSVTSMRNCFDGRLIMTTVPEIPESVNNMMNCFYNCRSLTSVSKIPEAVITMSGCFYGCTSLTAAPEIPESVTDMSYCFHNCQKLESVPNIPSNVTDLGYCFENCNELRQVPEIPGNVINMSGCFSGSRLSETPNIPASVAYMDYCFYKCASLSVPPEIPANVRSLRFCFYGCNGLKGNLYVNSDFMPADVIEIFGGRGNAPSISDLYIVTKGAARPAPWRNLVSFLPSSAKIHFEADDHPAPKPDIKVTRTDSQGEPVSEGEYVVIEIISHGINQMYLPDGWEAVYTSQRLVLDGTEVSGVADLSRIGPLQIDEDEHIIIYEINDKYEIGSIQVVLSKITALLDFFGNPPNKTYPKDLNGMGIAIGTIAKRNGLSVVFPTTIGEGLIPVTTHTYDRVYPEINPKGFGYYEKTNDDLYVKTEDTEVVEGKEYYSRRSNTERVNLDTSYLAIGRFNKTTDLSAREFFVIGNGTSDDNRSNAFVVDRNGRVTIGKTGSIAYESSKATHDMIRFIDSGEPYGDGIVVGNGGLTVIGAGEYPTLRMTDGHTGGSETLFLGSDNYIYIETNAQTYANRKTFTFDNDGTLRIPGNSGKSIRIGSVNGSYGHIYTDAPEFAFNKSIAMVNNGSIGTSDYPVSNMYINSGGFIYCKNGTTVRQILSFTENGAGIPLNLRTNGDIQIYGEIYRRATEADASKANNNVTSTRYPTPFIVTDNAGRVLVRNEAVIASDGRIGAHWYVRNYNTSGEQVAQKGFSMYMDKSGNMTYGGDFTLAQATISEDATINGFTLSNCTGTVSGYIQFTKTKTGIIMIGGRVNITNFVRTGANPSVSFTLPALVPTTVYPGDRIVGFRSQNTQEVIIFRTTAGSRTASLITTETYQNAQNGTLTFVIFNAIAF